MIWIVIEALLALALLVGVIVWVALPAQRRKTTPPPPTAPQQEDTPAPPSGDSDKS